MKQQIVPTSPKSEFKKERKSHHLFVAIVIAVLFGTLSGIFGVLIGTNIMSYFSGTDSVGSVFFSSTRKEQSVVTQAPEVLKQLASVYTSEPAIDAPSTWVGNAAALTADGWLVMPTSVFPTLSQKTAVVELSSGETTPIIESVQDTQTGMTFFRVEAQNLSVVSFPENAPLHAGQDVTLLTKHYGEPVLFERIIAGTHRTQVVQSSRAYGDLPIVDTEGEVQTVGAPAFLANGTFAGVVIENGNIVPSQWIHGVLQSVVRTKLATRTTLNIESVNTELLTAHERATQNFPEQGIAITSGDGALQTGDVIQVINGMRVDSTANLYDVIQSRPVGTTLYITVLRSGVTTPVELVL